MVPVIIFLTRYDDVARPSHTSNFDEFHPNDALFFLYSDKSSCCILNPVDDAF